MLFSFLPPSPRRLGEIVSSAHRNNCATKIIESQAFFSKIFSAPGDPLLERLCASMASGGRPVGLLP
jgi:hypothetical protein